MQFLECKNSVKILDGVCKFNSEALKHLRDMAGQKIDQNLATIHWIYTFSTLGL